MENERPNTVAGLLSKRAELAKLLKRVRADERLIISDLDHIDGAIRLFEPEVRADRVVRYPTQHRAKKGEVVRLVARMLREAERPITSLDIVYEQVRLRGLKPNDATLVTMRKRVGACLTKLKADGTVRVVPLPGLYQGWELAR
ncbi:hypothetical protein [uncultured Brevundimonas sp.]|uniref:hypothetical protein n=1 Tax=uncultured Brevundimonas sp. TaxID=213418 RepID=UPI0030EE8314|tara:strand:- start:113456 stop:113887 length:432 start_codon:yes stop_codon:yes gene_type:complete